MQLRVQLVPDRLDLPGVAADQLRRDLVLEQRTHRGASMPNRVGEPEARHALVRLDLERDELDMGYLVAARADSPSTPPDLARDAVVRGAAAGDCHGSDSAKASISSAPTSRPNSSSYVRVSPGASM